MKKNHKSILILVTFLVFLILCVFYSEDTLAHILEYSKLFITKVFPASFIFYILSSLLIEYGIIQVFFDIFHINTSSFYVLLISLISGFPSGAKYTKELLEKQFIDEIEANQIIQFSHFPNPLFVMGVVTSVLKSKILARKILFSIIISNLFLFFFRKKKKDNFLLKKEIYIPNFSNTLSKSIYQAFQTVILIYGTSLFFYLISFFLTKYFSFSILSFIFISGIFDLTNGVVATSLVSNCFFQAALILFFISFGGVSIHMQIMAIIADTSISYWNFLRGRIKGTILAFFCFLIFWIL